MRATFARVVPCLCALGVVLAPQPCAAQSLDLVWQAPPECPTLEEVRPILDAVIPLELRETLAETHVAIEIVAGAQYVATIRVERAGHVGERVVEGTRCAEVARSALIVVSVALSDPTAAAEPVAPEVAPPPQDDTAAVEPDTAQPVRWGVDGGVGVISGLGDAPVVPRLSLTVLHALHPVLQLGLRAQAAPFVPLRHMGERVARAATLTLAPVACALGRMGDSVRLGGCLSVEVGATLARGLGLDENARSAAPYAAVGLSPTITLGQRTGLRCSVDVDLRITRPRFEITNVGQVGRARGVGFGGTCAFFFWAS
jgi:hypothetical protein